MRFIIKHAIAGRLRVHMDQDAMTCVQADALQYYLEGLDFVTRVKVYERTADAAVEYTGERAALIEALRQFRYESVHPPQELLDSSCRALNGEFQEKLVLQVTRRVLFKAFLPASVRAILTVIRSVSYITKGLRCLRRGKMEVPVLDASAIAVSILRGDVDTAGSVMFLLGVGELLEDWTHKRSVGDLARSMTLHVNQVFKKVNGQDVPVPAASIRPGDQVAVYMGSSIPFDGNVVEGEAMVNQASLTGESQPVRKVSGSYVYAGTAIEEGALTIQVRAVSGSTRYERIIAMIEDSEKLKSAVESRAEHLADRLVPYTLAGTVLVWLLTRNVTKAMCVLMVDFSCALKLSMPITVLSAMREANAHNITVKGGKYLEALAQADTIVFDKTGTLTMARPTVRQVIPFAQWDEDEMLRVAACLEEHFPHSMAKAVVRAARERGLDHEEMHSHVDYIVAHGIASHIGAKRAVIGSYHFVFEDEGCTVQEERRAGLDRLPEDCSYLFLGIGGQLAAVICVEDPLRQSAPAAIAGLRAEGFQKIVMMTGDSERTAAAIAARVGVDAYYSEVLPEDKAAFIQKERAAGHKVVMIGDGINDSPALSEADVGIAIGDGAAIAREIADITIAAGSLEELVTLRCLSRAMMRRIDRNYRAIMGVNGTLIALGLLGVAQPTATAFMHNASTIVIGLDSMRNLLPPA
ncbi:MAG: heavy metal translocating P-type ATPase [Oscillospiraceae bacterium]|nr:heavy metal translocating P-type ATPase [Oscillospiraceae bacterium]